MNGKQAIYWHQGMFLQPQHFQQAELYAQFQLKPLFESGLPHSWGVGGLELVTSAIANRTIEIQSARLLFPDRSYVEYPGNAVIAPRPFDAAWVQGDKPLTVYLGLKKLSPQGANVTQVASPADAGSAATRFASLPHAPETVDLYSDGQPAHVRTLLHVVRIFFESEIDNLEHYDLIPIAQLEHDGDAVRLSESFIPPCYALSGSDVLTGIIKELRDEVAGRARQLQEYKSPRELQKAEFDANHLTFLLALRSLNRISPYLYHLTESRQVHPWIAYGALRQFIGELSSFSERFNMFGESEDGSPGLLPYDHAQLGKCFGRIRTLMSNMLNELTVGPEFLTILEYKDGYHCGTLPREFFAQRNRFYLVVRTDAAPELVINGMLTEARLAAAVEMPQLIAHALPGLELIHMTQAPQGLPRRNDAFYFRIEQMSRQWDTVERDGNIALYWLDAPSDLKAEIVVLRR